MDTKEFPCVVCGNPVESVADADPKEVLCPYHYFTEDMSEEWEAGDGTQEEDPE